MNGIAKVERIEGGWVVNIGPESLMLFMERFKEDAQTRADNINAAISAALTRAEQEGEARERKRWEEMESEKHG